MLYSKWFNLHQPIFVSAVCILIFNFRSHKHRFSCSAPLDCTY